MEAWTVDSEVYIEEMQNQYNDTRTESFTFSFLRIIMYLPEARIDNFYTGMI
jgi:hypothetical protein